MSKNLFDVELGSVLKRIRNERKMSMATAGEKIGVTRQAINHYEAGRVPLTVTQLKKLCSVYGVNYFDIMNEADLNMMNKDA